jgi:exodeoxyribonuclease VII small subunit
LERGEAPLEQSLALFEEGSKLLRQCTGLLDKAEQKVSKLTADGEVPFPPAEG